LFRLEQLNDSYGFLLAKVAEEMEFRFADKLTSYEINARQYGALLITKERPYSSQKEIAESLKIDRTTMVSHVDYLESLRYIQRTKNPNDRRSHCLVITGKGKEVLGHVGELCRRRNSMCYPI
jgi:DNA-binding MarR family transcriptional regulator